jgi:hypothetical protein
MTLQEGGIVPPHSVDTVPECTTRTPESAPFIRYVATTAQHDVDLELAQDRHHIAGVTEVVDITTGTGAT